MSKREDIGMSGYIPPKPSGRDEIIQRVTMGEWRPSRYDPDELVLTDVSDAEDGVLGVMPDGGQVNEYIDGAAYPTGVMVTLGAPAPMTDRLHGREDVVAVTVSVGRAGAAYAEYRYAKPQEHTLYPQPQHRYECSECGTTGYHYPAKGEVWTYDECIRFDRVTPGDRHVWVLEDTKQTQGTGERVFADA